MTTESKDAGRVVRPIRSGMFWFDASAGQIKRTMNDGRTVEVFEEDLLWIATELVETQRRFRPETDLFKGVAKQLADLDKATTALFAYYQAMA